MKRSMSLVFGAVGARSKHLQDVKHGKITIYRRIPEFVMLILCFLTVLHPCHGSSLIAQIPKIEGDTRFALSGEMTDAKSA